MKKIKMFQATSNERSLLVGLTKEQIAVAIIEHAPLCYLRQLCKVKKSLREKLLLDEHSRLKELMRLPKHELVEISYEAHDAVLKNRYNANYSTIKLPPVKLKEERAIEPISRNVLRRAATKAKKEKAEREAKVVSTVAFIPQTKQPVADPKPVLTRRQARAAAKQKTLNWIEQMRAGNKYICTDKYSA